MVAMTKAASRCCHQSASPAAPMHVPARPNQILFICIFIGTLSCPFVCLLFDAHRNGNVHSRRWITNLVVASLYVECGGKSMKRFCGSGGRFQHDLDRDLAFVNRKRLFRESKLFCGRSRVSNEADGKTICCLNCQLGCFQIGVSWWISIYVIAA